MKHIYSFIPLLFISLNIYSQATDFIVGLNIPQDILLDGNILYIAESDADRIIKVDLSAPNPQPELLISGIPNTRGLAINGTELYFSQLSSLNKISKIDLSDPNPTPIVVLENFMSAMDLLFYGNDLYIAQFGLDRIVKIDPSITDPPIVEVITGIETPIALELVGDELFIATYIDDKILKIDLTEPNPMPIDVITNLLLPVGLEHRGYELYIAEAGQNIGEDRISKINLTSSDPVRETVVSGLYNPTKGLEIYNDVLYIAENFKISEFGLPPFVSVPDFEIENISILPNPASDFVEVSGIGRPVNYRIFNISGAVIGSGVVSNNEKITIEHLYAGTYFLVLGNSTTMKIVKV